MSTQPAAAIRPALQADTAADLMRQQVISLRDSATVAEAIATLTQRGINACPVVNEAGQPVGVLSKADLLVHERERILAGTAAPSGAAGGEPTVVADLMTPAVFSVTLAAPAAKVVEQMVELNVHQLFVVDPAGVLIGTITALDVLQHLRA